MENSLHQPRWPHTPVQFKVKAGYESRTGFALCPLPSTWNIVHQHNLINLNRPVEVKYFQFVMINKYLTTW